MRSPITLDRYSHSAGFDLTILLPFGCMFTVWYWPGRKTVKTWEIGFERRACRLTPAQIADLDTPTRSKP